MRQRRGARRRVLPSLRRFNCRAPRLRSSSSGLFRSLSRTCDHPRLPSLCGIFYAVPSPICLSLFLALSFSSFVFVLSFGAFGRVSDERTLKQVYVGTLLCSQIRGHRGRCRCKIEELTLRMAADVEMKKCIFFQYLPSRFYVIEAQKSHSTFFALHILRH